MAREIPAYLRIASELRKQIEDKDIPPGSRLPTESELLAAYPDVSSGTARKAQRQLVTWGLAESRQGSGFWVRDFKPLVRDESARMTGTWQAGVSMWAEETEGRELVVDRIRVEETGGIPANVRETLGLADGETAIMRFRRFVLDGRPVMIARSHFPSSIAKGTAIAERDTGPGGSWARLTELGHKPVRWRKWRRATFADMEAIEQMELPMEAGWPVMETIRVAYDADGRAVEVNHMVSDGPALVYVE